MTNEERYKQALQILLNNLNPGGFDYRPMAYEMCHSLAVFTAAIINGKSLDEAATEADKVNS